MGSCTELCGFASVSTSSGQIQGGLGLPCHTAVTAERQGRIYVSLHWKACLMAKEADQTIQSRLAMATNHHELVLPLENTISPVVSCSLSAL